MTRGVFLRGYYFVLWSMSSFLWSLRTKAHPWQVSTVIRYFSHLEIYFMKGLISRWTSGTRIFLHFLISSNSFYIPLLITVRRTMPERGRYSGQKKSAKYITGSPPKKTSVGRVLMLNLVYLSILTDFRFWLEFRKVMFRLFLGLFSDLFHLEISVEYLVLDLVWGSYLGHFWLLLNSDSSFQKPSFNFFSTAFRLFFEKGNLANSVGRFFTETSAGATISLNFDCFSILTPVLENIFSIFFWPLSGFC